MSAATRERLIDPAILAQLANLELIARTAVEGALMGLHRSPSFGFSQEFAEYRPYVPGDDLRHIDWNVFARNDRMYIKRFFGDTNCQLMILLDTSISMDPDAGFHQAAVSKLDYAKIFAAALVYLASRQHDAVGLLAFDESIRSYRPPETRDRSIRALYHELESLTAEGGTAWQEALEHVQARLKRKSLIVVLSDFYMEPMQLEKVLRGLAARGHDILLVHVLDPQEKTLELDSAATLVDAETGSVMEVSPQEVATDYRARLDRHLSDLHRITRGMGAHYLHVDTSEPLDRSIGDYLKFRARHP
jgi:uncharacterized protein (DUF58 family)